MTQFASHGMCAVSRGGLCEVTQFSRHGMCATCVNNTASVAKNGIYIYISF